MAEENAADSKALVKLLRDEPRFVAELPKQFQDPITLGQAWIEGLIEFGRRTYVITGKPGPQAQYAGGVLIVEENIDWTGYKRKSHKMTRELLQEDSRPILDHKGEPIVEYRKYEPLTGIDPMTQKPYAPGSFQQVKIPEAEARKLIRLQIRICEKGFEQLRLAQIAQAA